VERDFRPLSDSGAQLLRYVIAYNLMGDEARASILAEPVRTITEHSLAPRSTREQAGPTASYVAMATLFVFFFLISMSSGFMLQSVSREKENRTAEVLLLSVRPRELMLGKVLGLSIVALLQMIIWVGGPLLLLRGYSQLQGQVVSALGASIRLPAGFMLWAVLYFLLGYLMYASLMAAIGALAPNARAAGQVTVVILLPLMIPLLVNTAFTQAPNGTLATVLSLFPLTAPTAMVTRLAMIPVPAWQLGVSLLGLGAVTYVLVLLAARFFRAETLLSDTALTLGRIAYELRGEPKTSVFPGDEG
jgi:ABC-2 type transport system permease protein